MAHVYNVKPQFAHYWYMASLYASACLIQEAEKLLKDFPGDGLLDYPCYWAACLDHAGYEESWIGRANRTALN
ncbi:hypothetical protein GIB67_003978 [Kingdonia uniflora]|uniref:Uncharacterized protein n=1 Tax=Kingdonia uniflora TaxID=39325 RepID=A0A7J7N9S4_9MAGN|nr:hypothetical protein GIB67_003978 [Kingdonia uniflora]